MKARETERSWSVHGPYLDCTESVPRPYLERTRSRPAGVKHACRGARLEEPPGSMGRPGVRNRPRGRRFEEPLRGVVGGRVAARVRGLERKAGGTTGLLVLAWGHNSAAIASAATSRDQAFSRSPVKTGNGKLNRFRDGMLCSASPPVPYPPREQSLVLAW